MSNKQYDAFISYCHTDASIVNDLDSGLTGLNGSVKLWWDQNINKRTNFFPHDIAQAIRSSRAFIVIVSRKSVESDWVRRELVYAKDKAKVECVVAIFLPECEQGLGFDGFDLLLGTHQQIHVCHDGIDSDVVQKCGEAIFSDPATSEDASTSDPQISLRLRPLEFEPDDLYVITSIDRPVIKACNEGFQQMLLRGNFEEAYTLVSDLQDFVKFPERSTVLAWLNCLAWYASLAGRTVSASELLHSYTTWNWHGLSLPRPEDLCHVCPPAHSQLCMAWKCSLDSICERVLYCLLFGPQGGSYQYALEAFQPLRAEVVGPMSLLVGIPLPGPLQTSDGVYEVAQQILPILDSGGGGTQDIRESVFSCQFPPSPHRMRDYGNECSESEHVMKAIQAIISLLKASETCAGAESALAAK